MKFRMAGILTSILLFSIAFSMPAHSETEGGKQERLGRAIQEAALLNQQGSDEAGAAQERLGRVIQEMAQASSQTTTKNGALQEQLGRQIQDSAALQYAQGLSQEKLGDTILQMARS